jgi:D-alanine-D-alanine ligase
MFVKPARLGSSVGISKVSDSTALAAALNLAFRYDRKVIVERAIKGREIECAVLGNEEPIAATPCEILPSREFYDYDDKYVLNQSGFRLPAELGEERSEEVRQLAVAAYSAIGCEGMARVDFLLEESSGTVYLSEINTIPGFTSISMYPKMWKHAGVGYTELITRLIELALSRREAVGRVQYAR